MFSENYVFISGSQYSSGSGNTVLSLRKKITFTPYKVMSPICKLFKSEKHMKNI